MPVISTNVCGASSLFDDGIDGILVQEDEPYSICGAILELINDPVKTQKLGKNARKWQLVRHNKESIINSLINNYTKILNRHNK